MRIMAICGILLALSTFSLSTPLQAAWELRRIDAAPNISSIELDGELTAYEKEGDIYLYQVSSGRRTRVTHDLYAPTDLIIALEDETLWYWAHDRHTYIYDLHRYFVQSGLDDRLFSFDSLIAEDQGTADAGRLVIWKDHDWCLLTNNLLEAITFSGDALTKQGAWLTGNHLVWSAVAGSPGVYVTDLSTKETVCVFEADEPPTSLWASGPHAAWVTPSSPAGGEYRIIHYRLDTGTLQTVGTSEASTPWQLAIDSPQLVWLKRAGSSWQVMGTHLEDNTEVCLYASERSMHTPRVSGNHVLLVTRNCQDGVELCSELNSLDRNTGILTQLTYFGADSVISSPWVQAGRIAFRRESKAFPFTKEAFVGSETHQPPGWTLPDATGSDGALNLALFLAPPAIAPWFNRRRTLRRRRLPS